MRKYLPFDTITLLLVLTLFLVGCGGNGSPGTTAPSTPTASTNQAGTGSKGLPLYCPISVAIDHQDTLYVSDNDQNMVHERIIKLSPTGQVLGEWHIFPPSPIGRLQGPGSAAFDAQGNMYVIDLGHHKVVKVSPTGKILTSWGSYGSGPGQFEEPDSVAVDAQGNVYIGDNNGDSARIEKFSDTGTFLGTVMAQVKYGPIGLAFDSSDNLYIANDISITKLSPTGQMLGQLQITGNNSVADTQWTGININAHGDFYATDLTMLHVSGDREPNIVKIDLATGKTLAIWNVWKSGIINIGSIVADSQGNVYATEAMKTGAMQLQKFSSTGAVLATWKGTCSSS